MRILQALTIFIVVQCLAWSTPEQRMEYGIVKWKAQGENGLWYICGQRLTLEEQKVAAQQVTKQVFTYAKKYNVNPWGAIGLMDHESRLDRCAIGKGTREWAVKKGMLIKNKRGFSYAEKDVLAVLKSDKWAASWKRSGTDLGIGQVLYYKVYHGKPEEMLQLGSGIEIVFKELANRAKLHKTLEPWKHWRGYRPIYAKHTASVIARARRMGATKYEI